MIPKKIHYCWFGGNAKSKLAKKCIDSWKKYCPDYEIIEWNESNFDVTQNNYLKFCYENKKWAFLSDMARLMIVYSEGGIYFDTDVEMIKNIDFMLGYKAFFGFENRKYINTGLGFGAEVHYPVIKDMLKPYEELQMSKDLSYPLVTGPQLNTAALKKWGLQLTGEKQYLKDMIILPADYMNPYDDPTGMLKKTENTLTIHWYSKSWLDRKSIVKSKITRPFHRIFGTECFRWLKKL